MHAGPRAEMLTQLQGAADVGARHQIRTGAAEVVCLDPSQFRRFLRLHQVVDAGAATAHASFCGLPELQSGDLVQQVPRLSLDPLPVNHVAGVVEGDRDPKGLQLFEEVFAQAAFRQEFVNIQIEAGLRTVGSRHPYDDFEGEEVTLRGGADVINRELLEELNDRLKVAGIVVDEAGLTHLAYASEIASAMLKRQQADAIIAARAKIVLGAVGMVEDALTKLSQDNIVEMDDERRAAMVSNLMVVLCGEKDANPVINAGSLYQ